MINNIVQLIDGQVISRPDKIALRHNNEAITYRELGTASNQISNFLNTRNFKGGDVIAVAMDRSIDMTICLLAIMKAGAAYLPIDPKLPAERIDFIIKDSGAKALIVSNEYKNIGKSQPNKLIFNDIWKNRDSYAATDLALDIRDNLAYILYTSGSTGKPKGVAVAHHNLLNLLLSIQKQPGITPGDIMLGITTMSFDISELELFLPLIAGAQLIIVDTDIAKDGRALAEVIEAEKISIVQATPFTYKMMLEYGWEKHLPIKVFCGGEAMTRDLADKLLDRCNEVWNMYGPTETTIYSIIKKVAKNGKPITIGHPVDNTQVYILDEDLNEVAKGEIGEIYIAGDGVAIGYVNRPELTAEKFVADNFSGVADKKMYRTGDLGKIVEGDEILCLGRVDHQIKINGFRIETEEIEYQLKQQKKIKDAYVISYEDSVQNLRLVAYLAPENTLSESDIKNCRKQLTKVLPDYMVPTDYVVVPSIPVMNNGKVDRKALPNPELGHNVAEYIAPSTDLEKTISEIWTNSLGISHIGANDNFFSLGGNSLLAAKTMVQIEKLTGKRLSLANLFRYPTIKQLASIIDDPSFTPYNSLIAIKPQGAKVPLYIVHGIGLNLLNFRGMVFNLDNDQPVYGLQSLGLNNKTEPLDSIEEIAASYNNEILMHNPNGPYAIGGYSFGGYIAFEMVKQLKAAGKDVRMLAMFDTNLQDREEKKSWWMRTGKKILRQVPKIIFRIKSFTELPKDNIQYLKTFYEQKLKGLYKPTDFQDERSSEELPDFMQLIANRLIAAFYKYHIEPVDIKIDLFKARKRLYFIDDPKFLGWKKYALKGVNCFIVPGDHKEMFSPPNDAILAKRLQKRLNEINN